MTEQEQETEGFRNQIEQLENDVLFWSRRAWAAERKLRELAAHVSELARVYVEGA